MSWLWWSLGLGVIVIFLVYRRPSPRQPVSARDEILGPLQRQWDAVDRELAKVKELILNLPVDSSTGGHAGLISRQDIGNAVSTFMRQAATIGAQTDTRMIHVVTSPTRITVILKLKPTRPEVAIRNYVRVGDDVWGYSSKTSPDMASAIRAAEVEGAVGD